MNLKHILIVSIFLCVGSDVGAGKGKASRSPRSKQPTKVQMQAAKRKSDGFVLATLFRDQSVSATIKDPVTSQVRHMDLAREYRSWRPHPDASNEFAVHKWECEDEGLFFTSDLPNAEAHAQQLKECRAQAQEDFFGKRIVQVRMKAKIDLNSKIGAADLISIGLRKKGINAAAVRAGVERLEEAEDRRFIAQTMATLKAARAKK